MIDARRFTLAIGTYRAVLTDLGARLLELHVPDRTGTPADVVLQRPSFTDIAADSTYMGATVGRCANRIHDGMAQIDGTPVQLSRNEGRNHLHGGQEGFDRKTWSTRMGDDEVTFSRVSPAGEEGYPGALTTSVTYRLTKAALRIDIRATTDAPTVVNVVHHSYFNLGGHDAGSVGDHVLQVHGSAYLPVDDASIPTGELRAVDGTPFDFGCPASIGANMIRAIGTEACQVTGFDHNWVLDGEGMREVAVLADPGSGRRMALSTNQPGLQVYAGGHLDGVTGKGAAGDYRAFAGVALEAQGFPDAVNHSHFPPAVLRPGDTYRNVVLLDFGQPRAARFTAETTARRDAVVMDVAMPTPHTVLPPTDAST